MNWSLLYTSLKCIIPVAIAVTTWFAYKVITNSNANKKTKEMSNTEKEELTRRLNHLFEQADKHVSTIAPIIEFAYQKVEEFDKKHKHDTVTLVGSIGNKLYFPEMLQDGSYQVELDVLYFRGMHNLKLPCMSPTYKKLPIVRLALDTRGIPNDETQSPSESYVHLLEVIAIEGEILDYDKDNFIETTKNGKMYLSSREYMTSIPAIYDNSIIGEREVDTVEPAFKLPLYRTFKTEESINFHAEGKEFKFDILMDKVAAVRIPWPSEALTYKTRDRKWPNSSFVESIIQDGSLLVHRPSFEGVFIEWKITFSLSEQTITTQFSFHQRFLFILLKLIKRKYFDLGTFRSGESVSGLTTYHMKTIFLWMSESIDQNVWSECPYSCFIMFLEKLRSCISTEICPHYFIPEINIMADIWNYNKTWENELDELNKSTPVKTTLLESIDSILQNSSEYLTEELFNVVDEKHVFERQKNTSMPMKYLGFLDDELDDAYHELGGMFDNCYKPQEIGS